MRLLRLFQSLAMTNFREFRQKSPSLRGVSEANDEAISFKISSRIRHCEGAKRPKQSRSSLNKQDLINKT